MIPIRDNIASRRWPVMNVLLVLGCAAVFFREVTASPRELEALVLRWSVVPARLLEDPLAGIPTIFTSMFLHGGWSHVLGNLMYLWIFGDNVEDRLGRFRYLVFYLCGGAAAALTQVALNPASRVPMIGASGAIAAVLGAYFVLYPRAKVLTLIPLGFFSRLVEIPAFFFLGFWFLLQALQSWGSVTRGAFRGDVGGVAWGAHAGGFAAGLLLVGFFRRR